MVEPLAHSAREPGLEPQTYRAHIAGTATSEGVNEGALRRADAMLRFYTDKAKCETIRNAVVDAATFHDLGKLDPEIQTALRQGRNARLGWDHIDAGVAHLRASGAYMAAWMVRAHHAPGLPSLPVHFAKSPNARRLRGVRRDEGVAPEVHEQQIARTDGLLDRMIAAHEAALGPHQPARSKALHGLSMRLALSCLVDADHSDTAYADTGWTAPDDVQPRWAERLASLDAYVADLGKREARSDDEKRRNDFRRRFYQACREREPDAALMACEGPVGIGKTTAVTAYLLRRAIATGARRLFIVAPYTAILSQTARTLREALVLEDERGRPDTIVAEHHHRADFSSISSRDLATLWTAPIVLTTAVQFFETLSANTPSNLRKLHALPGTVVFLDEAHAALPTPLWPQNWRWMRELTAHWGCSFVLASGSLARFWEVDDIVGDSNLRLPELVPPDLVAPLREAEDRRVSFVSLGRLDGPEALAEAVAAAPGPRLLIMNTVQSAAVMARLMRMKGNDVLHLSTALAPRHRDAVLGIVKERLDPKRRYSENWTLVATSLMEAGVDISFRTPFRESFATTSLIQIGGRGNRNFEWSEGVTVYDFLVSHIDGLKDHPAAAISAEVLYDLFRNNEFKKAVDPAQLVTLAMRKEIRRPGQPHENALLTAENEKRYPEAAKYGKVIDADTRLVVVDQDLRNRIIARERVSMQELLSGSVQIWTNKIDRLGLDSLPGRDEIFWWPHAYDPTFLGYMEGALFLEGVAEGAAIII